MTNVIRKALVVGGGIRHVEVAKILKSYGYFVVLVDYLQHPVAAQYADKHICANAFDKEVLLRIATEENVSNIVCVCHDLAIPAIAYVSEKLGLDFPFSYSCSLDYTVKSRMKAIFRAHGIPSARYLEVGVDSALPKDVEFPLVVKPVDSSGSRGVSKVEHRADYDIAVRNACAQSRTSTAIVEEFVTGQEYQVDCYVRNGVATVVMIRQKLRFDDDAVVSPAGSLVIPFDQVRDVKRFSDLAQKLATAFNVKTNTLFFQCIDHGGELSMIELGVRIGGGLSYRMIKEITGFDYLKAAVDAQLQVQNGDEPRRNPHYYMTNALFADKCIIGSISGLDFLLQDGVIDLYDIYKQAGDVVDGTITNKNRLAFYMVHGDSRAEICERMSRVLSSVCVQDKLGSSCLKSGEYVKLKRKLLQQG